MKNAKHIGLAVVTATALMACVGSSTASATVLCSTTTSPCTSKWPTGSKLTFNLSSGGSSKIVTTDEKTTLETCSSGSVEGEVTNAGSSTTTVTVRWLKWTFGICSFPITITIIGASEFHYSFPIHLTVTGDSEIKWTIHTVLFGSCAYGFTAGTSLGTVAGGSPATFTANAVAKKLTGSEAACPETAKWTASYTQSGSTSLFGESS